MLRIFAFALLMFPAWLAEQDVTGKYSFEFIMNTDGEKLMAVSSNDFLQITSDRKFYYQLAAKNNLVAEGTWELKKDTLVFHYTRPSDTTRFYYLPPAPPERLILQEGDVVFRFKRNHTLKGKP